MVLPKAPCRTAALVAGAGSVGAAFACGNPPAGTGISDTIVSDDAGRRVSRRTQRQAVSALVAAIALSALPAQVAAVDFIQNATGVCQPALPVFDGQIRKRPLAVQNEGTAPAFVSCSLTGTTSGVGGSGGRTVETVWLYAASSAATPATLGCTLVDNFSGNATPTAYVTKTVVLPADGTGVLQWNASDNGGTNFILVANLSCSVPVGVGLTLTRVDYRDP